MAELCSCSTGGGNTGRPSCYETFKVTKQLIFTEYFKSDGSVNGIDVSSLTGGKLDQTFLDERTQDLNPRTRWYPTPELKSITNERDEDITEDFEDTSSLFIQEGARKFTGLALKGDPVFVGNMKKWRCLTSGMFMVDKNQNLRGAQVVDGFLYPVRLQDESLSASLIYATDTTSEKTSIKFTVSSLEDDANLRMIEDTDITANLSGVGGLVDVSITGAPTSITTAGFTVQLDTSYGGMTNKIPAEGLQTADFSGVEISPTPGAVTITSVTESLINAGEYVFVITAETSGDILRFSNKTSGTLDKNFDLASFDVTIP